MTCQQCGSQAHGDLCVDCRIDQAAQAADLDRGDDYECPDCGGETSGKDVVCYRCRDSHQDGDGDDSDDGEDDAADAGDGEEAVLVADGGQDVPQSGDDIRVYGRPATLLTRYEERSGVWFEDNNTKDWVETDAIEPVDAPELVTDGGEDRCSECGAVLPEEIEPDTGVYCPECGTGQMVTDGGVDVDTAGETEVSGEPFDERAAKALTEYMVVLEDLPEVRDDSEQYVVVSQSGSTYTVDLRSESCECPDSLHRGVECKHRRRVAFATGRAVIPAWADLDRVHDRLGEHVSGAPRVETPHGTRTLEEVRD